MTPWNNLLHYYCLSITNNDMAWPIKLSTNQTLQLWTEQKGRCIYCNHSLILWDKYRKPTIEHIIPKSKGGTNHYDNLALACFKCNMYRGNIDLELFMDWYRSWTQHSWDNETNSTTIPRKVRWPKRWYHGNFIKW